MTCSGCGAEGVNIRTCPGDGSPHEATTTYQERTNGPVQAARPGRAPPALRLAPRAQAQRDGQADVLPDHRTACDQADERDDLLDDLATTNEGVERSEGWGDLAPRDEPTYIGAQVHEGRAEMTGTLGGRDADAWEDLEHVPNRPLQVTQVQVTLATTYPALAAARLEAFIEDELDECLWLSTDLVRLAATEYGEH